MSSQHILPPPPSRQIFYHRAWSLRPLTNVLLAHFTPLLPPHSEYFLRTQSLCSLTNILPVNFAPSAGLFFSLRNILTAHFPPPLKFHFWHSVIRFLANVLPAHFTPAPPPIPLRFFFSQSSVALLSHNFAPPPGFFFCAKHPYCVFCPPPPRTP